MKRTLTTLLALAGAGLLLTACEGGATLPAPGDARTNTDPFVECWNDACPPPPIEGNDTTPGPVYAVYEYGSRIHPYVSGTFKAVDLASWSEAIAHVAQTTVGARTYRAYGCSGSWSLMDEEYKSGAGSPLTLTAGYAAQYYGPVVFAWKIDGDHSFTPKAGYLGGGSFTSGQYHCL
jgi:hypothetical protein